MEHKEKMKTKTITNLKGKESHFGWYIFTIIDREGQVKQRSKLTIADFNDIHWGDTHIEARREGQRKSRQKKGKEFWKMYWRKYNDEHREMRNNDMRKYYANHKESYIKRNVQRNRALGFNPLNNPIKGVECEAHHINKEDIIYVPSIIHKRIRHSLKNGKNMKIINSIAYSFL